MVNKETVCAVVVTYNRKELLLACLEALLKQTHPLDAIYLIDNASNDGTQESLKEKGYISAILKSTTEPLESECLIKMFSENKLDKQVRVHYVKIHQNIGSAGGFHEGVKRGYAHGYDWLWLMDDDAEPYIDSLEHLFDKTKVYKTVLAAVVPVKIDMNNNIQEHHIGYIKKDRWKTIALRLDEYLDSCATKEVGYSSFVGPLISSRAVSCIGFPDRDFFIWDDDLDYSARLSNFGRILLVKDARMRHKDKLPGVHAGGKSESISSLWKKYYGERNSIFLRKKYYSNKFLLYFDLGYFFMREVKNILLRQDHKIVKLRILVKAYLHGFLGVRGMKINPEDWRKQYAGS